MNKSTTIICLWKVSHHKPLELTLQNIEEKCFSRRGSEEKTKVLGPVTDEGGSPEVDQVQELLRLDKKYGCSGPFC